MTGYVGLGYYITYYIINAKMGHTVINILQSLILIFFTCKVTKGLLFYENRPCELEYTWREI